MGKSTSKRADKAATKNAMANSFIPVDTKALDSNLSSLFASSVRSKRDVNAIKPLTSEYSLGQ